jgi:high-affinity iron transporter
LHLLDYIAVEYPEFVQDGRVTDDAEYAEQVEFSDQVANSLSAFPANERLADLQSSARQLHNEIVAKTDAKEVVALARGLQNGLTTAYDIRIAPASVPDLARAATLYESSCAGCHGATGDGRGPAALGLNPAPTDFTDRGRQSQRSVLGLFNTITLGVDGTAMTAFGNLPDSDRWALAFHVSNFMATDAERAEGQKVWAKEAAALFPDLQAVVNALPAEAQAQSQEKFVALAFLRAKPEMLSRASTVDNDPLSVASARTQESARLYAEGQAEQAYQTALSAYLDGFELAEGRLSPATRNRVEQKMVSFRGMLRSGASVEQVDRAKDELLGEYAQADQASYDAARSKTANFLSSFIIILREGLEAVLVLAAVGAFLVRSGRRDALPYVHFGWIAALLAGGVTWLVSSMLFTLSGAQRETTEGITALLAAALLLYAGYWLHSKSHATRWQSFIRGELSTALSSGQLWAMALVSFLAVYREAFETVLFMQALWLQADLAARGALVGGVAAGAAALTVAAWVIIRFSMRLPLGIFFGLSALFLAVLAVIFAGKGIAALQAAGKLPMSPTDFPGLPALGIYPNWQGLALQIVIVAIIAMGFMYSRASMRRT